MALIIGNVEYGMDIFNPCSTTSATESAAPLGESKSKGLRDTFSNDYDFSSNRFIGTFKVPIRYGQTPPLTPDNQDVPRKSPYLATLLITAWTSAHIMSLLSENVH